MIKIIIQNLNSQEIFSESKNRKVIELIQENYIDWMHACGKKGRCTTCKMIVIEGIDLLEPLTEREEFFQSKGRLKANERLTCQSIITEGDMIIRVAEENKFPHLTYSS
jgi:ferredoxin, 2Fe-2S